MKNKQVAKLLVTHDKLIQTDRIKVTSHVQREQDDWYINTLMLQGYDVPFRYKRKQPYKSLTGQQVNVTYYPAIETVTASIELEVMNIVRLKIS